MENERIDVLLVEDDEDDFFITRSFLDRAESTACALTWRDGYEEGLREALSGRYDVCLVDYRLGPMSGLDLIRAASERGARTPMILLTGQGDRALDMQAMQAGAADYLVKGKLDAQLLERTIRYARERRRAEARIRTQAALLDKARDAICAHDLEGNVIYWNKSAERLTGWKAEEIKAMPPGELRRRLYDEAEEEKLKKAGRAVKEKGEWMGELRHRTKSGGERVVESRWSLVEGAGTAEHVVVLVINTDVTERRQLETQRARSQRMESIGRLVGGIAHDLGNLLVPVLLGAEVLKQRFGGSDEKVERTLNMIHKSAERGSHMIKQVLAFARGVEGERTAVALGPIVNEVERLAEETFPPEIAFETRVPEGLWPVRGDATQVQQVLVNLCVNARDAMPEGGRLTVEAENVVMDENSAQLTMDARPGAYVSITVSDTGQGIAPEHVDKVFEPFFTTKEDGKGTGLGLSTVYSIVKSHGGFADVTSQPGQGTAFSLYFPIVEGADEAASKESYAEVRSGQGEGVLVVSEEAFVLEITREALRRGGYAPRTAATAEEALRLLKRHGERVHAVLSDLSLSGAGGPALLQELKRRRPDLPVVVTGSPMDGESAQAAEAGADAFLAKPFTTERLYATVGRLISEANTPVAPAT